MTQQANHYIPRKEDCPNIAEYLEKSVTVPIMRLGKVNRFDPADPPFDILGTTWEHPNTVGPMTLAQFLSGLSGAVKSLAGFIDERGECKAYPMSWKPKTIEGIGFLDFNTLKIDVRLVGRYGYLADHDDYGLSFHMVTLVGKD